jgi:hypothetical protein
MAKLTRHITADAYQFVVQGFVDEDQSIAIQEEKWFHEAGLERGIEGFYRADATFVPRDMIVNGIPNLEDILIIHTCGRTEETTWGITSEDCVDHKLRNTDWFVRDAESPSGFKVITNDEAVSGNF